jgi:hypothetical protein
VPGLFCVCLNEDACPVDHHHHAELRANRRGLLVEISDAGFQLPAPNASGPTTPPPPTVRVLVGDRLASDVRVFAADRLTCIIPAGVPGGADVIVENLDAAGTPIPGEQAVAIDAITYVRPPLTVEADLTRMVRVLLQQLKREVLANVVLTVHTDFDRELGELHLAQVAQLPGLVLLGRTWPRTGSSRSTSGPRYRPTPVSSPSAAFRTPSTSPYPPSSTCHPYVLS